MAASLSFWLPGLGQLYSACIVRGLGIGVASTLLTAFAVDLASPGALWACRLPDNPASATGAWGASIGLWIWNISDARRRAAPSEVLERNRHE